MDQQYNNVCIIINDVKFFVCCSVQIHQCNILFSWIFQLYCFLKEHIQRWQFFRFFENVFIKNFVYSFVFKDSFKKGWIDKNNSIIYFYTLWLMIKYIISFDIYITFLCSPEDLISKSKKVLDKWKWFHLLNRVSWSVGFALSESIK